MYAAGQRRVEALSQALAPLTEALGIPAPCLPLALLRPFSGSGALSIGSDIIRSQGPDSLAGLTAAVMLGSSETSIYCIALYSAALGIKNTRWALPAALAGDLAAFFLSALSVRLFLPVKNAPAPRCKCCFWALPAPWPSA